MPAARKPLGPVERAKATKARLESIHIPIDTVYTLDDAKAAKLDRAYNQLEKRYDVPAEIYPQGEVSPYTFGQTNRNKSWSDTEQGAALIKTQDDFKKAGVGGRAEFWLKPKNKLYGPGSRIELMPARRSFTPVQGQQVPGAGAGMEIRVKSNIARLPIPGSRPVIQHMGIAEETISFVGAFCGFDIPQEDASNPNISWLTYGERRIGNAYDDAMNLLEGIRAGWELELVMRWNSEEHDDHYEDIAIEYGPQVRYTGYVKHFVKEFATAQKVYYRIEFIVSNRETTILKDNIDAPSLAPQSITGGVGGLNVLAGKPLPKQGTNPNNDTNSTGKSDYQEEARRETTTGSEGSKEQAKQAVERTMTGSDRLQSVGQLFTASGAPKVDVVASGQYKYTYQNGKGTGSASGVPTTAVGLRDGATDKNSNSKIFDSAIHYQTGTTIYYHQGKEVDRVTNDAAYFFGKFQLQDNFTSDQQ